MITDANSSITVTASSTPGNSTSHTITAASQPPATRNTQQKALPTSVPARVTADLFSNEPDSYALGSGVSETALVAANTSTSFLFTVASNNGAPIIAIPDVAFFIGSFSSSTQWPNPTYGMGNMPVAVFNDWGLTDNYNVVTRATIRNNTGLDQVVICIGRFRIVTNPSITPQASTSSQPDRTSSQLGALPGEGGVP